MAKQRGSQCGSRTVRSLAILIRRQVAQLLMLYWMIQISFESRETLFFEIMFVNYGDHDINHAMIYTMICIP